MPTFKSFDGVELHYDVQGDASERPPVVLLHGFAADTDLNWVRTGVAGALLDAGRRVVTLDARGHGRSEKPHEPHAYANDAMVADVSELADEVELEIFDVVGYSMGGRTASLVAGREPRLRAAVLGGVGGDAFRRRTEFRHAVADALVADDPAAADVPAEAQAFRQFADATGADRHALAGVMRAGGPVTPEELARITAPVLVLTGTEDDLVGDPRAVADLIPGAVVARCPGDHLGAPATPEFAAAVVDFLAGQD